MDLGKGPNKNILLSLGSCCVWPEQLWELCGRRGHPPSQSDQPGRQSGDSCSEHCPRIPLWCRSLRDGRQPEYQGTPVQPHKAVMSTWTHQAQEDPGVSNSGVIFGSLEKLIVRRTETSPSWIWQQWGLQSRAGPEAKWLGRVCLASALPPSTPSV